MFNYETADMRDKLEFAIRKFIINNLLQHCWCNDKVEDSLFQLFS